MNEHQDLSPPRGGKQVALFVTCLADLFRPSVAFASIKLLEQAGCEVVVPLQQTCCGQPAYNSGDYESTVPLARQVIDLLEPYDYVVAPSGSCAGMICVHYPRLLQGEWRVMVNRFFDTAVFYDTGKVTEHSRDLDLDGLRHDVGFGIRFHGPRSTPWRVDFAQGNEGLHMVWAASASF